MNPSFTEKQIEVARQFAKRYIWWEEPNIFLDSDPLFILAQVMNLGTAEDWALMLDNFDKRILVTVLKKAKKGWFDTKRWNFWHLYLDVCPPNMVPPLPRRILRLGNGKVIEV